MTESHEKSKSSIIGRPTYHGLVKRVAAKMGVTPAVVSHVKRGITPNRKIRIALEAEMRAMDRERASA